MTTTATQLQLFPCQCAEHIHGRIISADGSVKTFTAPAEDSADLWKWFNQYGVKSHQVEYIAMGDHHEFFINLKSAAGA